MAGSDKRQRSRQYSVRFTDAEAAELERKASDAGLSVAAYLRAASLGDAGPRAARRPPVEREQLVLLSGLVGKLGSNVNQIARALNSGDAPDGLSDDIKAAAVEVAEMRATIRDTLGWKPTEQDRQSRPNGQSEPDGQGGAP